MISISTAVITARNIVISYYIIKNSVMVYNISAIFYNGTKFIIKKLKFKK